MDVSKKRKKIDDFFQVDHVKRLKKLESVKPAKCQTSSSIPGLSIIENFVSAKEEQTLLDFLHNQPWRTDLSRRVIHYGGQYCLLPPRNATPEERQRIENEIFIAEPIPAEVSFLTARLAGQNLYTALSVPRFCIVNEYKERQGISAHIENFRFKSPVCGLSLVNGDWMRFHELENPDGGSVRSGKAATAARTGQSKDIWMPWRSLIVMNGDARCKWQHEIVKSKKGRHGLDWRRVSLTFRTDIENHNASADPQLHRNRPS